MSDLDDGLRGRVVRDSARARAIGTLAVVLACGFAGLALVTLVYTALQVRDLSRANRDALAVQAEGAQFAVDATNCIRFALLEHRWVNEEYHIRAAGALGIEPVVHAPLPPRPSPPALQLACRRADVSGLMERLP